MQTTFSIETNGPGLYEFTRKVESWVDGLGGGLYTGLVTLLIRHTSASLLIQENASPEVRADLCEFFHRMVPPADDPVMDFLTHTQEGTDDMPAHIKAALLPVSLSIPIVNGRLRTGTWQGIFVFEHRTTPQVRQVAAHMS
ncbi:MAG: YjbQ family protein [Rhodobacteraceae bacterium]|nr:MAG: YjbQ family protein [Paracoccaceae bacterium]